MLRGRARHADLGLAVSEPDPAVYADGRLPGISHDHQRRGGQMAGSIPGSVAEQRGGQALSAGVRMGRHLLIAGHPAPVRKHAQLRGQLTVEERPEPRPVTGSGQRAPGRISGL